MAGGRLQEIRCTVMVSPPYSARRRVPEFSTQIYEIGTLDNDYFDSTGIEVLQHTGKIST